jgi:predicted P-loop ATPase
MKTKIIEVDGYVFEIKMARITNKKPTYQEYLMAKDICNIYENNLKIEKLAYKNDNMPIRDYQFCIRTKNVLLNNYLIDRNANMKDLRKIIEATPLKQLMGIRGFGKKLYEEVCKAVYF